MCILVVPRYLTRRHAGMTLRLIWQVRHRRPGNSIHIPDRRTRRLTPTKWVRCKDDCGGYEIIQLGHFGYCVECLAGGVNGWRVGIRIPAFRAAGGDGREGE